MLPSAAKSKAERRNTESLRLSSKVPATAAIPNPMLSRPRPRDTSIPRAMELRSLAFNPSRQAMAVIRPPTKAIRLLLPVASPALRVSPASLKEWAACSSVASPNSSNQLRPHQQPRPPGLDLSTICIPPI